MDTRTAYLLDSIISISKKMVMPRIGLDQSKNFLCAFSLGLAYEIKQGRNDFIYSQISKFNITGPI